jgi:hypothetical protein
MQTIDEFLNGLKERENSVKAPSRNALIAPQADLAKKIKALLNRYETKKLAADKYPDSPWNRYGAGHEIGSLLFGESPELLDDMSYGLNPLTKGHTGRIPIPDKRLLDMPIPTPAEGALGVIKNKGGNWLTGSVENAVKGLKKTYGTTGKPVEEILQQLNAKYTPEELARLETSNPDLYNKLVSNLAGHRARLEPQAATNQWIDGPLVNYIKNSMATPEDPIRLRADRLAQKAEDRYYAAKEKAFNKYPNDEDLVKRTNDITRARERYEDEMSGILHYEPDQLDNRITNFVNRRELGFPEEGFASTKLGRQWEKESDWLATPEKADEYLHEFTGNPSVIDQKLLSENPWLTTIPPESSVHSLDTAAPRYLGLDHLTDEIGNALSPTSDLPANLRLTPEDLANPRRNSMESMVDLVARVNQHRRRMAIEAEKKSNEAIRDYPDWNVVKEYPDGYRMVRLPDVADSEEAFKIGKACGEKGGWCTQGDDMLRNYGSGQSRVNLLLDPDGKPVAQVETVKPKEVTPYLYLRNNHPEIEQQIDSKFDQYYEGLKQNGVKLSTSERIKLHDQLASETPEYQQYLQEPPKFNINQIKGKHNGKPKAEHIPYLQDFVKSGNFSDVSELDNVDMQRFNQSFMTSEDIAHQLDDDEAFRQWYRSKNEYDPPSLLDYPGDTDVAAGLMSWYNEYRRSLIGGGI